MTDNQLAHEYKPRSVAIVGYSNINLKYAKESKADELWTMNHHVFLQERMDADKRDIFRCDRLFELHRPEWFTRKEIPDALLYRKWLQEKKEFPIYMLDQMDEFPSCVKFQRDILKKELFSHLWRGDQNEVEYYTSSVCMMIAFAIHLGVERIEFYGVEALTDTEYADQKPGIEFMQGFAMGRGIDIVLHPTCALLNAQVYGYEGVPHIVHDRLDALIVHYKKLLEEADANANKIVAAFNSGKETDNNKAMDAVDWKHMYGGAVNAITILQNEHDAYVSAQFLEEKYRLYKNEEEQFKGKANMAKAESEILIKQKKKDEAKKVWDRYQHDRSVMMAFSGAIQVLKKLRDECRLMKPDHYLTKLIVE
ncbi:hypothetical protein CCP3SC15_910006 [Gammaproteobacteria bacterium]